MRARIGKHKTTATALACAALFTALAHGGETDSDADRDARQESYLVKSVEHGKASWYSTRTNGGTETASGDKLRDEAPTAAHKTLPMGTKVRVINPANNKSAIVTINDRGPFKKGRVIDVTIGIAKKLGFVKRGVVPVKVEVLKEIRPESTDSE